MGSPNMKKLVFPDYNKSTLTLIGSFKKHFKESYPYPSNVELDEVLKTNKYNHIVFLILDGLGSIVLKNNLRSGKFLLKKKVKDLVTIFPSTTAAATTSLLSGKTPLETGWTGWENYLKEEQRDIILFTGVDYFTNAPTGISLYKYLPYTYFWQNFPVFTRRIMPSFDPLGVNSFREGLLTLKEQFQKEDKSFTYFYWTEPDGIMHDYGTKSNEACYEINSLNKQLEDFYKTMPEDALVVVTADHGQLDVEQINLLEDVELYKMLNRRPANDARALSFTVKEEFLEEFPLYFNKHYGEWFTLYKGEDAIQKGFFGDPEKFVMNSHLPDFISDYFAVGISNKYFSYIDMPPLFKGHHAGMTEEEMLVPLIMIYK